jgi:hypothetical protein
MDNVDLIQAMRQEILEISHKYGGRNVRLFGSVARSQAKRGSDLDLLVEMKPGSSLLDVVAIKQDLEDLLGCKVHVVTEDALSPYIRAEVIKQSVSL